MSTRELTISQDDTYDIAIRLAKRQAMAADGLKSLIDMNSRLRDSVLPAIEKFVQEREKLGEYDTSAVAIIELSKIVLDLSQYVRAHVRAQLDIAISE